MTEHTGIEFPMIPAVPAFSADETGNLRAGPARYAIEKTGER
jgi:hypothetical protein